MNEIYESKNNLFKLICIIFLLQISFCNFSVFSQNKGTLTVLIKNIEEAKGKIYVSLFSSEDGFPMKADKALRKIMFEPRVTQKAVFHNLIYGDYAVSVHHDEDSDKEMDTNFFGIPSEGIGVSNNAKGSFGPPDFDDAKFTINEQEKKISIKLVYL